MFATFIHTETRISIPQFEYMYSLAKLLTEEPEKLERMLLSFFKLLIVLYLTNLIFDLNFSISGFVENPIPDDYSIFELILFIICLILVWIAVWGVIGDLLLAELLIWATSKIGKDESAFKNLLVAIKVLEKEEYGHSPAKNVILFSSVLQIYDDDIAQLVNESKSRIRRYHVAIIVTYFVLLCTPDEIPSWLVWIGTFMSINSLIACAAIHKFHRYFQENRDVMKKQFDGLAYMQMIINSLQQNHFIKEHYEMTNKWRRVVLKRKSKVEGLPERLRFFPVFHWNDSLTKIIVNDSLEKQARKNKQREGDVNFYDVIISNVKPDDDNIRSIKSQPYFAYLHCEDEERIYENMEVFLFKISQGTYRIH